MISKDYTIVIATYNERARIGTIIKNIKGRARIIIIDNNSTDDTCEIARQEDCEVFQHANAGFWDRPEYEFMFSKIRTEWFLLVYCGHYYSKELLDKCEEVIQTKLYDAIALEGKTIQYGKETNAYGNIRRRIHTLSRFAKKTSIDLSKSRIHHELPYIGSQERMFYPELRDPYLIQNFRDDDFSMLHKKNLSYCPAEAAQRLVNGELPSTFRLLWRPAYDLIKRLFWRGSILEGWTGISIAIGMSYRELFLEVSMFEQYRKVTSKEISKKNIEVRENLCNELNKTEK